MTDRWTSAAVQCKGGLVLNVDTLTQGTLMPGTARVLQNFEPSISGGYRRINGFIKFDSTTVPGDSNAPILGTKVALGGIFAVRMVNAGGGGESNSIYFSTGSGWSAVLNGTARPGGVVKARFINYSISAPVVILTDGVNAAWKWNGTVETTLNGAGAPTNPKYSAFYRNRLVLSGYSANTSAITVSSPNDDTNYAAISGAVEINVGDVVTGIKTFREVLYIFCTNSIKKLIGSSIADFEIQDVTKNIGCIGHDTIQEIGGDLIFLAQDGLRSMAATERIDDIELGLVSTNIQPIITPILGQAIDDYLFSSCAVRNKSQYRLFVNNPSYDEANNLNYLGKFQDSPTIPQGNYEWATIIGVKPYCADSDYTNDQEYSIIGHPTNGYVYRMESGSTFDGTNIVAIYRTPDITFTSDQADATIRKVFHKLAVYSQVEGDFALEVSLKLDKEDSNILQPDSIGLSQTGAVPVYGSAIYDTSLYGQVTFPVFYTNLIGSGFTGAFLYTCNDASASFRVDSFQVTVANKGRR